MEDEDKVRFLAPRTPFLFGAYLEGSENEGSGLEPNDEIVAIAGNPITYFDQAKPILEDHKGQNIEIAVKRDGIDDDLNIPVKVSDSASIGVYLGRMTFEDLEKAPFFRAITSR